MLRTRVLALTVAAFAAATLAACAPASSPDESPDAGGTDSGNTDSSNTDGGAVDSGGGNAGSATVTVDGETWEYPNYLCVVGYEQTSSDVYSFSSTSFTTVDGEKIQILVDVRDDSGQNRLAGDGVEYEVTVFDADSPSSPTVNVSASGTEGVAISGDSVQVDGSFTDRDGTSYNIQVDATCGG